MRATAALAALLCGCLNDVQEFQYPNTNLGGDVTIDGSPIDAGSISFLSLGNGQLVNTYIVRGRYIADKVPLGKVLVVITAIKKTGRMSTEDGRQFPETINLIPPKYQNGFELDVASNTSRVDFKMTLEGAVPRPVASGGAGSEPEKGVPESNSN